VVCARGRVQAGSCKLVLVLRLSGEQQATPPPAGQTAAAAAGKPQPGHAAAVLQTAGAGWAGCCGFTVSAPAPATRGHAAHACRQRPGCASGCAMTPPD
jgi:hypothetical protein